MNRISRYFALLFDELLEGLEIFKILHIFAFGIDEFADDKVSSCTFLRMLGRGGKITDLGSSKKVSLLEDIEDSIDDGGNLSNVAHQLWSMPLVGEKVTGQANRGNGRTDLNKPGGIVPVQIHDQKTFVGWKLKILQTGLHELEGGRLCALRLRNLRLVDFERNLRAQGIVDRHQRISLSQASPHRRDRVDGIIGIVILFHLLQMAFESGHFTQALPQLDTDLVERSGGVCDLIDDAVAGHDGAAIGGGGGSAG